MGHFIQALESRTFLSATLLNDQSVFTTDAAAVKATAKVIAAADKTALAAITVDLKTLPKTNAALFKTVKTDTSKIASLTASDSNSITGNSAKLAKKAVAAGDSLLSAWSLKSESAVATDATQLNSIVVAPLGKLSLDLSGPLVTDLGVIGTANPTATQLQNDITALDAAYAADAAALTSAASTYQSSLTTLSTDLTAIPNVPNIVFDYSGAIKETAGSAKGKSLKFSVDITTEDSLGSWQGTYTSTNGAGVVVSQPAEGEANDTGGFSGDLANGTLFTGTVSGKTIKGIAQSGTATGSFSVSHK
jgi:hypothetical protein